MPRVLAVNKGAHDYSAARSRGNLVFMSDGRIEPLSIGRMARTFAPFINDSDTDDFLMVTGLTVMNVVAAGMLAYKHKKLNLLIFSRDKYLNREVYMPGFVEKGE